MNLRLFANALGKYVAGLAAVMLLLFPPAGTLRYPGGWRLIVLLFGPMLLLGAVLLLRAPALLEKRLRSKESRSEQRQVVALSAVLFLAAFVVSGLDFRFGVSAVPAPVTAAACAVLLLSYGLYAEVMRENAYLSRTVEIQADQKLIDTGLYGVVRHPMYMATVGLFLSMPLVLGSFIGFLILLPYPLLLVRRIRNEEALLLDGLPGYGPYMEKVKYRLIPFLW